MVREDSRKGMWQAWGLGLLAIALVLTSCGSGSSAPVTSVIDLKSPSIGADGATLPDAHCGYGPIWLSLEWETPPEGTKELAIYFARFKYVKGPGNGRKPVLTYADLLSNIKPTLHRLPANVLPDGADWSYIGQSCPAANTGQTLVAQVFALDRADAPREMKRPLATRLTEEAMADPHPEEAPRSPGKLTRNAVAVGRLIATDGHPQS
jgi:hypothetical protein